MIGTRFGPVRSLGLLAFAAACGAWAFSRVAAQDPGPEAPPATQGPGYTSEDAAGLEDELSERAREEVAIAEARIRAKQAEIRLAETRLDHERDVLEHYASMVKRGMMPASNEVRARRLFVESEALLEVKKADLTELGVRLARARRVAARPGLAPRDRGIAERLDDIERRQFEVERRLDALLSLSHEQQDAANRRQ